MKTATTFKAKAGLTPSFTSPLKSAVDSATNEANVIIDLAHRDKVMSFFK